MEELSQYLATSRVFLVTALLLQALGLVGLLLTHHLIRKVLALNVLATGVFMLLGVLSLQPTAAEPASDPLPHALILTGIVVAFSTSALAIGLSRRLHSITGDVRLPEEESR